ncbi:hypothetical protein FRB94_009218 [Tulasnella sp. JGI-2019a]|nr:hypothetical protein FRB93_008347 [Tulasnella sp. JGI-2019a]KAG8995356.1 hypothetical protein FRB94_009218 [Tulasnella sp. JGI-2019a]
MVFSAATRIVRRRSSAIKLSAVMEEFGEIPIILGFDPLRKRDIHHHDNVISDVKHQEDHVDIGDYPMAILTRGATAMDPVIQVAPHVHVIHAAKKRKRSDAGVEVEGTPTSVSFSKWALSVPPSLSLAISNWNPTSSSPSITPPESDGETTPKASEFSEAAKLKLDSSCSSSATMALARRAHVRLPSSSNLRRTGSKNHRESRGDVEEEERNQQNEQHNENDNSIVAPTSFLPLRPTNRPIRVRHKRFPGSQTSFVSETEGNKESTSDALPLQPTSINNVPTTPSPSRHDSIILPVATLLMSQSSSSSYYDNRHSALHRWSSSPFNTVSTPIDWSLLESTLGCAEPDPSIPTVTPKATGKPLPSSRTKTSPPRPAEPKLFKDRPLPHLPPRVPEIVVHHPEMRPSSASKQKRRGVMMGGPGIVCKVEATPVSELLPGCSGIEFD